MDITIHVHHHFDGEAGGHNEVLARLDAIAGAIAALARTEAKEMQQLDDLKAEVARATAVEQSAIALIQGLAAQIEALKDDPAALQALADQLKASDSALADAVAANTPAAPNA